MKAPCGFCSWWALRHASRWATWASATVMNSACRCAKGKRHTALICTARPRGASCTGGRLAAGNSLDDLPMLGRSRGAGLLCVPGAGAGVGVAEGPRQLAAAAEAEGYWLHEATAGPKDWRRLAWETAQAEAT